MLPSTAPYPRLLPLGDAAWTIEFGTSIDPELHARVMGLAHALRHPAVHDPVFGVIEDVVPSFRSLTVHFDPAQHLGPALGRRLLQLAHQTRAHHPQGRHWHLPVCIDAESAPDLDHVAAHTGCTPETVIQRVLDTRLRVYLIGFQPGFPYMGDLPPELATPRRAQPRLRVPGQSLAIADRLCAIYPWDSPGGWQLLGHVPVTLFDPNGASPASLLAAGDTVSWFRVARHEIERHRVVSPIEPPSGAPDDRH